MDELSSEFSESEEDDGIFSKDEILREMGFNQSLIRRTSEPEKNYAKQKLEQGRL